MNGITTHNPAGSAAPVPQKTEGKKTSETRNSYKTDAAADVKGTVVSSKTSKSESLAAANEAKLSGKEKEFIAKLREKYGDYDFFVADKQGDFSKLAKAGSKEFSVIISRDELEKMAADEKYADEKMKSVEDAVKMAKEINEKYAEASEDGKENGKGAYINRLTIEIGNDGGMKIFAELEKTSDSQRIRIEKNREKKAEEKKTEEKKAAKKRNDRSDKAKDTKRPDRANPYDWDDSDSVKRTVIEAATPEELLEKMQDVDWSKIAGSRSGDRFDFTA